MLTVDPVPAHIDSGREAIANHPCGHLVENRLGSVTDIPAPDDAFDAAVARHVLVHVEDLSRALAECRRVLDAGGAMVIQDAFATPYLEPNEASRLCADLALAPERLDGELFERTVTGAGFGIEVVDRVGSERLEAVLEAENGERRLLRAARLLRDRDRLVGEMGVVPYRVLWGNTIFTIYRLIGKLEERVYVIRAGG